MNLGTEYLVCMRPSAPENLGKAYLINLPSIMCIAPRYSQLHFRSVILLQSPSSQIGLPEKEKQAQKFREDPFSYWVSHSRTW